MRTAIAAGLSTIVAAATPAFGAGYQVKENSAAAMGAAYAGSAAADDSASYLVYNPAAALADGEFDLSFSGVVVLPSSSATYRTATTSAGNPAGGSLRPRNFVSNATIPALAARYRISDRWAFGFSIAAPWGLRTDYPAGWAGRYYALKTELVTVDATPALSYRVTPNLVVAAGPEIEFASGALTSAIDTGTLGAALGVPGSIPGAQDSFASVSGTNWNYGYVLGAIAHLDNGLSLGLSYRSSIEHNLNGPLIFRLDSSGIGETIRSLTGLFIDTRQHTEVTVPETASFGARQAISERWTGLLELDWTGWGRISELRVDAQNPFQPDDVTSLRWRDAWFGSLGAEYRADPDWALRAGAAYDESPVPHATRDPRLPDTDRIWLSAGVSYRWRPDATLTLAVAHLFNLDSSVNLNPSQPGNTLRGTLVGVTRSDVNAIGIQIDFRP